MTADSYDAAPTAGGQPPDRRTLLTPREVEVLRLIVPAGYDAELVVLPGDPVADVTALRNVQAV